MSRLAPLRTATAHLVWVVACLLALLFAGGALLVALRADPGSAWGWWLRAADAVAPGWFDRGEGRSVGGADVRDVVLRWGSAAGAVLAAGAAAQWVVRPRSSVR